MATFTGFPEETFAFLTELRANNAKPWLDAHRDDYEAQYLAPARAFVEDMGEMLLEVAPEVRFEPRVNGSIFRVNRDIRFSNDKTPYKDHLALWFWDGAERREATSGFYLRLLPDQVGIGVGAHRFDKDRLASYRELVVDATAGTALLAAVDSVERAGYMVHGEHYQRVPTGFDADGRAADLLRHRALFAGEDVPVPASVHDRRFLGWCLRRWEKMAPLHRWLVDHLQGS